MIFLIINQIISYFSYFLPLQFPPIPPDKYNTGKYHSEPPGNRKHPGLRVTETQTVYPNPPAKNSHPKKVGKTFINRPASHSGSL